LDLIDMARYLGALLFTLALLALFLLALRRLGPTLGLERLMPGRAGPRRLAVVEALMLDPRRRLVIVRADDREHVVLLGASGETLIESRAAADGGKT
jgi:flagellar protein FliO/FliZ